MNLDLNGLPKSCLRKWL
ncbi:hypothetical protein CGLO_18328 [Colletotrichum gloeosporioides Cg-14]|uniref:Uncharacterized protein n=1 Tax=Colletotrichum gloeosporioides (strain Cg-14) TaxID=1237896 RepID=T0L4E0_COLGC|nr:hypothetical protein CGLO_18328 [Colletotrichum gloeosporioides Cg-14]